MNKFEKLGFKQLHFALHWPRVSTGIPANTYILENTSYQIRPLLTHELPIDTMWELINMTNDPNKMLRFTGTVDEIVEYVSKNLKK
jgi:hypothetical protein